MIEHSISEICVLLDTTHHCNVAHFEDDDVVLDVNLSKNTDTSAIQFFCIQ